MSTGLQSIKFVNGKCEILDQLLLPLKSEYIPISSCEDSWKAINTMQVRGAPAIGIVGCFGLAADLRSQSFSTVSEMKLFIETKFDYLITSRPTAVNLLDAKLRLLQYILDNSNQDVSQLSLMVVSWLERQLEEDVSFCKAIGEFGAEAIVSGSKGKEIVALTHCNTGSLATGGYGTALGVVRSLHTRGVLKHVFCTETRPYNQGARLTAFEIVHDELPGTLICDDMVAAAMKLKAVNAVVVGADRIVANGDAANKIGTYQIALLAKHHGIPFYVAAPTTSIDLRLRTGEDIVIEERPADEMVSIAKTRIAPHGVNVWNPAFDVTPADLITGIVTEKGVFAPEVLELELKKLSQDKTTG